MSGCIPWPGTLTNGYGMIQRRGRGAQRIPAHRFVYELVHGPIPDGLVIDHTCHNADLTCTDWDACQHRRCVNLAHLEAVTAGENTRRGHNPGMRVSLSPYCANGHLLDEYNAYLDSEGGRRCRTCQRRRSRKYMAKQRGQSLDVTDYVGSRSPNPRLSPEQRNELRETYSKGGVTMAVLAERYRVSHATVSRVVNRKVA
jgi:hypothetical protein